ncbi:MAG: hypothetical protein PsegKO_20160 [Pseudohongiellaceae bacterium]
MDTVGPAKQEVVLVGIGHTENRQAREVDLTDTHLLTGRQGRVFLPGKAIARRGGLKLGAAIQLRRLLLGPGGQRHKHGSKDGQAGG